MAQAIWSAAWFLSLAIAVPTVAVAQPENEAARAPGLTSYDMPFGSRPEQRLALWRPGSRGAAPIVLWVPSPDHLESRGAETRDDWLPTMFTEAGWAVAKMGVRTQRQSADEMIADVGLALAELRERAERLRIDPSRVILLGTGSGAPLAALLGVDPARFSSNDGMASPVRAVIMIDGEAFDFERHAGEASRYRIGQYRRVYGLNPGRYSPVRHLAGPNAPRFLFLQAESPPSRWAASERFAVALRANGSRADLVAITRTIRDAARTYLGAPQHPRTRELQETLRALAAD